MNPAPSQQVPEFAFTRSAYSQPVTGIINRHLRDVPSDHITTEFHTQSRPFSPGHGQRHIDHILVGISLKIFFQYLTVIDQLFDIIRRTEQGIDLGDAAIVPAVDLKNSGYPGDQAVDVHQGADHGLSELPLVATHKAQPGVGFLDEDIDCLVDILFIEPFMASGQSGKEFVYQPGQHDVA